MIDGLVLRARAWQPEVVLSSDLQRCLRPAEAITEACGVRCEADPVWREIHMGEWENQPWADLQAKHPEALDCVTKDYVTVRAPGGESYEQLADRTFGALRGLETRPEQRIWVMTHGGVIRAIVSRILGLPLKQSWAMETAYASGVLVRWSSPDWKVVFV
jgi:broad specificity phosphatase PhoE